MIEGLDLISGIGPCYLLAFEDDYYKYLRLMNRLSMSEFHIGTPVGSWELRRMM